MKIIAECSGEYNDMINSYYYLERFDDNSNSEVLFQGYSTSVNDLLKEKYKNYDKRVYLNLEAPCAYCSTTSCNDDQSYFTHVYTLCPYSSEWLNESGNTKFVPIPFPYAKKCFEHIDYDAEKIYDVMYMGQLLGPEHYRIIDILKNYNYVHTSLTSYRPPYEPTHIGIHSSIKWDMLSKSKVSIALNLAPIESHHINYITQYPYWDKNQAFKDLRSGYIPQFKPRVIESMVCKTLVLVKYDQWNVIENWFEPDTHFLYWYSLEDLFHKLHHIVHNYKSYQPIVEAAYKKVKEYEIENIFEKIKNYESF